MAETSVSEPVFNGPLFIVGMPRSGTKLLRNLLNQHPRVCLLEVETEFLPWLVHHVGEYGDLLDLQNFRRFHADIVRFPYFMYRSDEGRVLEANTWHAACRRHDAGGVFEALVRSEVAAPSGSSMIWGDKSPSYIDDIPLISSLYPQARFIHIIRDVRDYCLSMRKAWGKDMFRAAQRWADGVAGAREDGTRVGSAYLEVRYEDLLGDVEGTMRRVCEHLGIELDPSILELEKPSENIGDARGASKVVKGNFGKFRNLMRPAELKRIESIAKPVLQACGYELVYPSITARSLSSTERFLAQARDGWNLMRAESKERGMVGAILFHVRYFRATRG